nr:YlxR family protein [Cellulomonas sp. KRMCY2]
MGCRERGLRSVLLRVVQVGGDQGSSSVVVDTERSRPGRGAWLHADLRCLELAERRRAFPRALRTGPLDVTPVRAFLESAQVAG